MFRRFPRYGVQSKSSAATDCGATGFQVYRKRIGKSMTKNMGGGVSPALVLLNSYPVESITTFKQR